MKTLLEIMNKNLETNFKTVKEYAESAKDIDMQTVAQTLYQYMYYQEAIDNTDIDRYKIKLNIEKEN